MNNYETIKRKHFVISDTHFFHKEIEDYERRGKGFNEKIVKRWNGVVGENDIVFHLGDLTIGGETNGVFDVIKQLKGKKILVRGNHDKKSDSYYYNLGFDFVCDEFKLKNMYGKDLVFTHIPLKNEELKEGEINVHGHLHSGIHRGMNLNVETHILYNPEKTGFNLMPMTLDFLIKKREKDLKKTKFKNFFIRNEGKEVKRIYTLGKITLELLETLNVDGYEFKGSVESTGIVDRNGRELFDGDYVSYTYSKIAGVIKGNEVEINKELLNDMNEEQINEMQNYIKDLFENGHVFFKRDRYNILDSLVDGGKDL